MRFIISKLYAWSMTIVANKVSISWEIFSNKLFIKVIGSKNGKMEQDFSKLDKL